MLDGRYYDVFIFALTGGERGAFDREVVRFGTAGCKNDLRWLCPDKRGDLRPGIFHSFAGFLAVGMQAGRVAV